MKILRYLNFNLSLVVLLLMFVFTVTSLAQLPEHYNYNTAGTNNSFPMGISTGKMLQSLYLPGDFTTPAPAANGFITKFYMRVNETYPINNLTYNQLYIMMGRSNITTLPTGAFYTGTMDTVFKRASYLINAPGGTWISFTLDTPFLYDPTMSLVVEVGQCGFTGGATTFPMCNTTLTGFRRTYSVGGCPFTYSGQGAQVFHAGVDIVPSNCGYVWAPQTSGTTNQLYSVKAVNNLVAWTGGAAATVRKTTNGGVNWVDANPNPGVINGIVYALDAFDANLAWCTTSPGATFIYRTTNGGVNWTQVFTQAGGFIDDIKFRDANTGFAMGDPVGGRWSLWKSTDGGATWDSTGLYLLATGSDAGWNNAMFNIGNTIWVGTDNTRIYKSTSYGATGSWTFGVTTGQVNSYSLHFNSPLLGLMGGTNGLRTTDGGATWGSIGTVPGTGNLTGMEGFGTDFWYTRGTAIYRSTNSGDNWTLSFTAAGSLLDIDLWASTGCLQGWAVGATGTIVKMNGDTLVGIGNNNNRIPNTYILEQNYPNPFNPSTTINFALPRAGLVELKVYDVLGRETATLVNEVRQAGSYKVDFDASALSSGVYFYTLKSGEFTDTKKMLLIK